MPAAKLTKGIVYNKMGDQTEAKSIFQSLTKDYPNRPEAFNNLAVIYAEEGEYPKAIETFQQAFQTHPSYAQVHSNLKELYATLASQAYNKALNLDQNATEPALAMIDQVPNTLSESNTDQLLLLDSSPVLDTTLQQTSTITEQPINEKKKNETSISSAINNIEKTSTTNNVHAELTEIINANTLPHKEKFNNKTEPVHPIADQTISKAPISTPDTALEQEVVTHLKQWANTWSNQDYDGYIASYIDMYRPNEKLTHQQWAKQRQQRITKPEFIRVNLKNIVIKELNKDLAEVRFDQYYQSNTYKDAITKRVVMVNENGQWKISLERNFGLAE